MARRSKLRRTKHVRYKQRRLFWWMLLAFLLLSAAAYATYLDIVVRQQFEGKRWALPARVYARPLELFVGKKLDTDAFVQELEGLRYRFVRDPRYPGEVARRGDVFVLASRPFMFWDGIQEPQEVRVVLEYGRVSAMQDLTSGKRRDVVRLDPELIGILYPSHHEDRLLVRLRDVPQRLTEMLVAMEDRDFYRHHGIAPRAIARAMLVNLRAWHVVQGGSTLTQQLVKNFFLSNERTLARKFNEAVMAALLEIHYSKHEILQAYLNEVFLGQDGQRAIHGFGLASQYYFERALTELSLERVALLVALVKGASYYDPRRHPDRAKTRRDLVLKVATEFGILSPREAKYAMEQPLGVVGRRPASANRHPAFLDLVRNQLHRDYQDEDLTSEGLQIFTTLDPWVQESLERALSAQLPRLEAKQSMEPGSLQGAAVVTSTEAGEVLALTGGREPRYAGFNRALDAVRPVGSIVKSAIYLTALQHPEQFTLATLLDDVPLTVSSKHAKDWRPQNYDGEFHGKVALYQALAHSYNVATVALGLRVGVSEVIDTLHRMGLTRSAEPYPSLLLGSLELPPIEVAQLYQTLASGGFRNPLRAIRAVVAADGTPLQRYPVSVQQAFEPEPIYLINTALQAVIREGTGRGLGKFLSLDSDLAGKTGTTDGLRDSWFAGFSGDRLAVVWLGRDDNQPTGLTGSSGAMQVWGQFMAKAGIQPLELVPTPSIVYAWIDADSGLRSSAECRDAVQLPFILGSVPSESTKCSVMGKGLGGRTRWLNRAQ
ncbi:MAG: penicillin-binding protein 1B [Gammaproteobacteria bacterium]